MCRFDEYLNAVSEQIRVKRIRQPLMMELEDHLLLQKDAYLNEGLSEAEAERRAIEDMGDAILVGGELDSVHRPRIQWKGIIVALFFMALGTIFQILFGSEGLINGKYLAFSLAAAGMLLLVSMVDYTAWMKLTFPVLGFWLILWLKRFTDIAFGIHILTILSRTPSQYNLDRTFNLLFSTLIPECICVAAPLLTAFLICRLRGQKWNAFAACTAIPVLTAALAKAYWQTGYNSSAMMLTAICGFAVMFVAIGRGFFQIRQQTGFIILSALCILSIVFFAHRLIGYLSYEPPEYLTETYEVIAASRLFGHGAEVENLSSWAWEYPTLPETLLSKIIYQFGWIPFFALTAAFIGLIGWLLVRFIRMKNRMGALLGFSATLTLAVQCIIYYLHSFTAYPHLLGLPLISYGNAMLVIDSILIGTILSVLRSENLPEAKASLFVHPTSA